MAFDVDFLHTMTAIAVYNQFIEDDAYGAPVYAGSAASTNLPAHVQYQTKIVYGDEEENQTSNAQIQIPPPGFIWYANNPSINAAGVYDGMANADITTIATWSNGAGVLPVSTVANSSSSGALIIATSNGVASISYTGTQTSPTMAFTGCTLLNGSGLVASGADFDNNITPTVQTYDFFTLPDGTARHCLNIVSHFDDTAGQATIHHVTVYLD